MDVHRLSLIDHQRTLRQRGYVMWDSTRLAQWSILDHEWLKLPHELPITYFKQCHREVVAAVSFDARLKIWRRGGRGWWSAGDESRIVWPPGGPNEDLQERS